MTVAPKGIKWNTNTPSDWVRVFNQANSDRSYWLNMKTGQRRKTRPEPEKVSPSLTNETSSEPAKAGTNFGFWNNINIQLSAVFGEN